MWHRTRCRPSWHRRRGRRPALGWSAHGRVKQAPAARGVLECQAVKEGPPRLLGELQHRAGILGVADLHGTLARTGLNTVGRTAAVRTLDPAGLQAVSAVAVARLPPGHLGGHPPTMPGTANRWTGGKVIRNGSSGPR